MENYGSVNKISKMVVVNWSDDDEVERLFNDEAKKKYICVYCHMSTKSRVGRSGLIFFFYYY